MQDKQTKKKVKENCHAVNVNGYSCRCKAMSGQVFCYAHLLQGYGLFTKVVISSFSRYQPLI